MTPTSSGCRLGSAVGWGGGLPGGAKPSAGSSDHGGKLAVLVSLLHVNPCRAGSDLENVHRVFAEVKNPFPLVDLD